MRRTTQPDAQIRTKYGVSRQISGRSGFAVELVQPAGHPGEDLVRQRRYAVKQAGELARSDAEQFEPRGGGHRRIALVVRAIKQCKLAEIVARPEHCNVSAA